MAGNSLTSVALLLSMLQMIRSPASSAALASGDGHSSLPGIEKVTTFRIWNTKFSGELHKQYQAPNISIFREIFDKETDLDKDSMYHSWETAWTSGKRRATLIKIKQNNRNTNATTETHHTSFNESESVKTSRRRARRQIYGDDNRYYIPAKVFANKFPFSSVVKVSTGCTGALVSQRHVITAAHCLHDQKDYVPGFRFLRVGLISNKSEFEWVKVRSVRIPLGWKVGGDVAPHFDYALMRLEVKQERPFLPITISEDSKHGRGDRIHFTAFEDDKPWNTMWYRYCRVEYDSAHVLYHYCDAKPGSSGSGVYVWEYDLTKRVWDRKLIGVFSGNRWLYFPEWYIPPQNFNAAIRITSLKYVQLCKWMGHSGAKVCDKRLLPPEPTPTVSSITVSPTPSISPNAAGVVTGGVGTGEAAQIKPTVSTPVPGRTDNVQDRLKPSPSSRAGRRQDRQKSKENRRLNRKRNKRGRHRKQYDDGR